MAPDAALDDLIGQVVDGAPLDWDALEAATDDDEERDLLKQLRLIADVGAVHRSEATLVQPAARMPRGRIVPFPGVQAPKLPAGAVPPTRGSEVWGHFELIERVGAGTFGEVYRARDTRLDREVAIKLLRPDVASDERQLERLVQEGQALARIEHPNVVRVHSIEQHNGRIGLCMELLAGPTLEDLVQARGAFTVEQAAEAGREVCAALTAVHRAGLLHRDVKARNVIRTSTGRVVLMDFGAGQFMTPTRNLESTMAGKITGTPLYLAPEVLEGEPSSERSDIYAVGVLLYRLVTGLYPVTADDLPSLMAAHRARPSLRPALATLPSWFASTVLTAMEPAPNRRWSSAGAMAEALVAPSTIARTARVERPSDRPQALTLSRRLTLALSIAMVALMAALGALLYRGGVPPTKTVKVAIMPFADQTSRPAWFASGLSQELQLAVSGLPGLLLSSSDAVAAALDDGPPEPGDAPTVFAATKADRVLFASVGDRAGALQVDLSLFGPASPLEPLWRSSVQMPAEGPFTFKPELVAALMTALIGHPPKSAPAPAQPALPVDVLPRYWQASAMLVQASRDSLVSARQLFESLTTEFPEFDRGWAGLAQTLTELRLRNQVGPEAQALATAAVQQSLRINEGLADAHVLAADIALYFDWDRRLAEQEYARALELNPSHARARTQYARYLAAVGRLDQALEHARANLELNPVQAEALATVGITLYYSRRFDDAQGYFESAVGEEPRSPQRRLALARVLAEQKRFALALNELEQSVELSGQLPGNLAELARTYAAAGRRDDALAVLARTDVTFEPEQLAYVYATLGDHTRALDLLEAAVERRATTTLWAGVDPRLDPLRGHPRFIALLEQLHPAP